MSRKKNLKGATAMEVTKEQEIENIKDKKLVYSNEFFLIYEDENKNIECLNLSGKTFLSFCSNGDIKVYGDSVTKVYGGGCTVTYGDGITRNYGTESTFINNKRAYA